jgi:hypothetical protein
VPTAFTLRSVDVEITPEPSDEERQAILAALRVEAAEHASPTLWWRAGLEPDDDEERYATVPARQRRGATRA